MRDVRVHPWEPGEICSGPIHVWVRENDYFRRCLEYCRWCVAIRHRQWWDNEVYLVPVSNEYPHLPDPYGDAVQFDVRRKEAIA